MSRAHDKVLVPAETLDGTPMCKDLIHRRLKEVATAITDHYGPYTRDRRLVPLCVAVQFGAMFIHPMLLSCMDKEFPTYVGTIRAKSYKENGVRSKVEITNPCFDCEVQDRRILIIDDIVESGQTLFALKKWFEEAGASDVRSFALLDKPHKRVFEIGVDWVGFHLKPEQWVVGMGLDDGGLFRHFNNIVVLRDPKRKGSDHGQLRKSC